MLSTANVYSVVDFIYNTAEGLSLIHHFIPIYIDVPCG